MQEPSNPQRKRIKGTVALLLAFAAGCVDIVGYLSFGKLFTAHLTGSTVHLGEWLTEARSQDAARAAAIIAVFVVGSIIGRTAIEVGSRLRLRSVAVVTLFLEAGFIASVIPAGHTQLFSLLMLAAAMGVQTATLTRIGSLTVHTTFVTGMLNKLAQLLSHVVFLTYDVLRGSRAAITARLKALRDARFIFSVWLFYLAGAASGTWMKFRVELHALLLPGVLVLSLAIVDLISPLAVEEERDVPER
ncbi:MAG: YoaK family protein [Candidatus Sulfotelmatobacter sp.]